MMDIGIRGTYSPIRNTPRGWKRRPGIRNSNTETVKLEIKAERGGPKPDNRPAAKRESTNLSGVSVGEEQNQSGYKAPAMAERHPANVQTRT